MKAESSAEGKVLGKYDGDWSRIHDIVRGAVLVKTESQLAPALKAVQDAAAKEGWKVENVDNRFVTGPIAGGYRDVSMHLTSPTGFKAELQINTQAMFDAKESGGGHALYEQTREIERAAGAAGRPLTPTEQATVDSLRNQSAKLYSDAYARSRG